MPSLLLYTVQYLCRVKGCLGFANKTPLQVTSFHETSRHKMFNYETSHMANVPITKHSMWQNIFKVPRQNTPARNVPLTKRLYHKISQMTKRPHYLTSQSLKSNVTKYPITKRPIQYQNDLLSKYLIQLILKVSRKKKVLRRGRCSFQTAAMETQTAPNQLHKKLSNYGG